MMRWRDISPPSSGSKSDPSINPAEVGCNLRTPLTIRFCWFLAWLTLWPWKCNWPLNQWVGCHKLHGITTQETLPFVVTSVRNSKPTQFLHQMFFSYSKCLKFCFWYSSAEGMLLMRQMVTFDLTKRSFSSLMCITLDLSMQTLSASCWCLVSASCSCCSFSARSCSRVMHLSLSLCSSWAGEVSTVYYYYYFLIGLKMGFYPLGVVLQ
jgi:hypothetical protein